MDGHPRDDVAAHSHSCPPLRQDGAEHAHALLSGARRELRAFCEQPPLLGVAGEERHRARKLVPGRVSASDQHCDVQPEAPLVPMPVDDLLVRASMDLRGKRPSLAELDAVEADPNAYAQIVDQYLYGPEFIERVKDQSGLGISTGASACRAAPLASAFRAGSPAGSAAATLRMDHARLRFSPSRWTICRSLRSVTVAGVLATSGCSIFIASRMTMTVPLSTWSPLLTST